MKDFHLAIMTPCRPETMSNLCHAVMLHLSNDVMPSIHQDVIEDGCPSVCIESPMERWTAG
jgi:hypothetical protein